MVLLVILGCCEVPHVRVGYSLEAGQRCCDRVFEVWHEPGDPCGVYLDYLLEFFLLSSDTSAVRSVYIHGCGDFR